MLQLIFNYLRFLSSLWSSVLIRFQADSHYVRIRSCCIFAYHSVHQSLWASIPPSTFDLITPSIVFDYPVFFVSFPSISNELVVLLSYGVVLHSHFILLSRSLRTCKERQLAKPICFIRFDFRILITPLESSGRPLRLIAGPCIPLFSSVSPCLPQYSSAVRIPLCSPEPTQLSATIFDPFL